MTFQGAFSGLPGGVEGPVGEQSSAVYFGAFLQKAIGASGSDLPPVADDVRNVGLENPLSLRFIRIAAGPA